MHRMFAVFVLGAGLLAGCQGTAASRLGARAVHRPAEAVREPIFDEARREKPPSAGAGSQSAGKVRLVAGEDADEGVAASVPTGPNLAALSLDDAIETGLVQNPDLVALRQAEGVSEAAFGVAQTYPINPWVQVQVTPFQRIAEGGNGSVTHYVLMMQTLQIAHQQQFRECIAASQLNQVRWNIHNLELLNTAQTARLYFTALYQRGLRDLARSSAELNQELLRINESQLEAGAMSPADLAIVRIDARATLQQAQLADQLYRTALLDLRRQLNISLEMPLELTGSLTDVRWNSAYAAARGQIGSAADAWEVKIAADTELIKRLTNGRPDLMAARADIETAYENYRLANASRTPDLQIGPYYAHDDFGSNFYGLRAQMDLPVLNNGKPLVRQRTAEHQQRHITMEQLQARAELEAVAAVVRYEQARELADASRRDTPDDLPAELRKLETQFQAQDVDVVRVFQGRTSLIQNRRTILDSLNEAAQAAAAVTAFTGIPPKALVSFVESDGK